MVIIRTAYVSGHTEKKILKAVAKMPEKEQELFSYLHDDLQRTGPIQKGWSNFSTLGKNKYHCHLSYHWVACWQETVKGIELEVYYAGSRENAPY